MTFSKVCWINFQINISITKIGEIVTTLHHVCHVMSYHVLLQEKEMERQLLEACETGDLPNVKKLCRVVDVNEVRNTLWPCYAPLHYAALYVKHGPNLKSDLVYNDNVLHRKRPKFNND